MQEIQAFRGEATLLHVDRIGNMSEAEVIALFHKARATEYQAVLRGWVAKVKVSASVRVQVDVDPYSFL